MPVQITLERVTLWATGGQILMRLQVVARGRGRARFRTAAYGCDDVVQRMAFINLVKIAELPGTVNSGLLEQCKAANK